MVPVEDTAPAVSHSGSGRRNPDSVLDVVTVDAFPHGLTGEEGAERIRKLFHKMRFLLPPARPGTVRPGHRRQPRQRER